jgi:hypothetical protein
VKKKGIQNMADVGCSKRKHHIGLFFPLCILFLYSNVLAQIGDGSISFSLFGSIGVPLWTNDPVQLNDNFKAGNGIGSDFTCRLGGSTHLALQVAYQTFKPDMSGILEDMGFVFQNTGSIDEISRVKDILIISVNLKQMFVVSEKSFGISIKAGGGYYIALNDEIILKMTQYGYSFEYKEHLDSPDGFGLNGGFGMESLLKGKISLFTEGLFHYLLTDSKQKIFLTFKSGLRITF